MTLEMQTALERELKDAKTPEDRALAQSHILKGEVRRGCGKGGGEGKRGVHATDGGGTCAGGVRGRELHDEVSDLRAAPTFCGAGRPRVCT